MSKVLLRSVENTCTQILIIVFFSTYANIKKEKSVFYLPIRRYIKEIDITKTAGTSGVE